MLKLVHAAAGAAALALIAAFWMSTAVSELFGARDQIVAVKSAIAWGLLALAPALAAVGGSGLALAKGRRAGLVAAKLRRMPLVALNGLLILVPAALFLSAKARAGEFDASFYLVQAVELVAGAVNLRLLALNMRDGLKMTGRLRKPRVR